MYNIIRMIEKLLNRYYKKVMVTVTALQVTCYFSL